MVTLTGTSEWLVNISLVAGTVVFAVSGASMAKRHKMDWLGIVVLGIIVAIGGGTVRDVLLGREVFWISQPWYLGVAAATGALVIILASLTTIDPGTWRTIVVADAVGLAIVTMVGTDIALDAGTDGWVAIILGVITGTGGGLLRDVLANEKPMVLTGEVYAVASASGAGLHVILINTDLNPSLIWWLPVVVTLGLRIAAIARGWSLPHFEDEPAGR